MELDDLKLRWQDHDRKLDRLLRINARLLQAPTLSKAHWAMQRLTLLLWGGLLLNFGAAAAFGSFLADHQSEARFAIPAAALQVGVIALLAASIRQLAAIGQLDFAGPIVELQKRLESLRTARLRATKWTLLLAPLAWTPLLIVTFKGLFGVDAYAAFPPAWLAGNAIFGVAFLGLAMAVARRYAERLKGSPLAQRLLRDLAGHNLNAATAFLGSLDRFAAEE
jgi:hypothetical protein